jgi:hypothetical protein
MPDTYRGRAMPSNSYSSSPTSPTSHGAGSLSRTFSPSIVELLRKVDPVDAPSLLAAASHAVQLDEAEAKKAEEAAESPRGKKSRLGRAPSSFDAASAGGSGGGGSGGCSNDTFDGTGTPAVDDAVVPGAGAFCALHFPSVPCPCRAAPAAATGAAAGGSGGGSSEEDNGTSHKAERPDAAAVSVVARAIARAAGVAARAGAGAYRGPHLPFIPCPAASEVGCGGCRSPRHR